MEILIRVVAVAASAIHVAVSSRKFFAALAKLNCDADVAALVQAPMPGHRAFDDQAFPVRLGFR
jgi:hypothetical protein